MAKTRLNISLDQDIAEFVKIFAAENRTTVADIVTQYILNLKRISQGEEAKAIFANTAFKEAMLEAQKKLRDGNARWHSFDEVFE